MNITRNSEGCVLDITDTPGIPDTSIKILQLTDMQVIDASQVRTQDRLRADEIEAWQPENVGKICYEPIKTLVGKTKPDLIIITGDIIYGEFDDSGRQLRAFCDFMGSQILNYPNISALFS